MSKRRALNLDLSAALLGWEMRRPDTDATSAIQGAFRRLHDGLSKLVGSAGYRALFGRALHVTKREHEWLGALDVSASPFAILQLEEQVTIVGAARAVQGATSLFATVLDLFCAFIGEELTLRHVHEAWSDMPAGDARAAAPEETK